MEIFYSIFGDFGEITVGEFGVVYCYRGMTAMNDKCLLSTPVEGKGPLDIPFGESRRILCNTFDLAFHKKFDRHTRILDRDHLFFLNVVVLPKGELESKKMVILPVIELVEFHLVATGYSHDLRYILFRDRRR